jgi:hypothetical protein
MSKVGHDCPPATPDLKAMWRQLFETEPPPYNRRFLESRLAYRIQELAYGGLKPATVERLAALAEDLDGGDPAKRRRPAKDRPIAGTRLIRDWQGVEHCVTVRDDGYEYRCPGIEVVVMSTPLYKLPSPRRPLDP